MRSPAIVAGLALLLAVAAFLAGRQGGAEPARSDAQAPVALKAAGKAPRISALRSAPAPPPLAREKRRSARAEQPAVGDTPVQTTTTTPQATTTQPQTVTPQQPADTSPAETPPDLGTRDE